MITLLVVVPNSVENTASISKQKFYENLIMLLILQILKNSHELLYFTIKPSQNAQYRVGQMVVTFLGFFFAGRCKDDNLRLCYSVNLVRTVVHMTRKIKKSFVAFENIQIQPSQTKNAMFPPFSCKIVYISYEITLVFFNPRNHYGVSYLIY